MIIEIYTTFGINTTPSEYGGGERKREEDLYYIPQVCIFTLNTDSLEFLVH